MAIHAELRGKLPAGTKLTGKYKGADYQAEVVKGEGGTLGYRLADGREFGSPSAAGAALMGGTACNGWRFWSVVPPATKRKQSAAKPATAARGTR